ncbi:hypothetical protein ACH4MG_34710 [Streptomyces sp. NPDC017454]|uniref:hypothetical protein n=1 Tax=Streptomyces sp. NPDC017454 TaxID=3364997 RepID=UPI0037963627
MAGWRRFFWWALAVLGGAVAVGLTVLAVAGDLDTADRVASVVGALAALAALCLSVHAALRPATSPVPPVHARDGSNAAGGSIRDASARDTGTAPAGPDTGGGTGGISASGGSNAAGGDIDGSTAHRGG